MSFLDVAITTDPDDLTDAAIDALTTAMVDAGYVGYTPNEGNFEIILLSVLAEMAADVANVATQVPSAIFRTFGTVLLGLPYNQGASATIQTTWQLADTVGHTIPAGTYVTVASLGFYVLNTVTVPGPVSFTGTTNGTNTVTSVSSFSGLAIGQVVTAADIAGLTITALSPTTSSLTLSSVASASNTAEAMTAGTNTASVYLVATDSGTDYNGFSSPIVPVDQIDWLLTISAVGVSSGGSDAEQDQDYQNRLAAELALQAPRPITASDYATFTLTVPSNIVPTGVTVGRSTAIDGYNPVTTTFTGTLTASSNVVTSVSSTTNLTVGTAVSGTNIPAGTTLTAVGTTTVTMSNPASAAASGETITGVGSYNNERTVTIFVTDVDGNALTSTTMMDIQQWLEGYRELNFVINVEPPSYSTIYITFEVHVLPGYSAPSVVAAVQAALTNYLSPATWGSSLSTGSPSWLNTTAGFNVVRYNKVLGVIENTLGVDYVPNGQLFIGTSASPTGTSDIVLAGPAPLPMSSTTTITGTSV